MRLFLFNYLKLKLKSNLYKNILKDIDNIIDYSVPTFTNLGNITALLKNNFNWFWVGFYKVEGNFLILNAFQGPVACVKIPKGKGVCGKSWDKEKSIIVDNVELFEGHINCNKESKSEIVIPIKNKKGVITYILDIDHDKINAFNKIDEMSLSSINNLILELV
jgi:GAF domain-containing protein|tara:strand:+ start:61 stop:549 length:489 start_codon:yes stop_codon:yes gene_type:complete